MSNMTPKAQRIAIAETCGWTEIINRQVTGTDLSNGHQETYHRLEGVPKTGIPLGWQYCIVSDYLTDLNAMHEAEKVLNEIQRIKYARELGIACGELIENLADRDGEIYENLLFNFIHSTAAQRAEAFLRCLNLWTTK